VSDRVSHEVEAWRSVAAGWERRRPLFWEATHGLSSRLVALLEPQPGQTVLELAAGPGDTGFLAAGQLGPSGRLISSDVVPEMVDAARRRAGELGTANAEFRVLDAAAIDLPEAAVDGVLCRFGLMLVVDMDAAFDEVARVLRPGGRAAIAVWAEAERNPWITAGGAAAAELGLLEPGEPDAPGPFRLADPERLRALADGAGLALETLEEVAVDWRAGTLDEWWDTWSDTSRALSRLAGHASADDLAALRAGAERRLAAYRSDDGSYAVPGVARAALLIKA
jgi:SAM-dependent methyltransferase